MAKGRCLQSSEWLPFKAVPWVLRAGEEVGRADGPVATFLGKPVCMLGPKSRKEVGEMRVRFALSLNTKQ